MTGTSNTREATRAAARGESNTDESHLPDPHHFMESMIQQYTNLVEDLSAELYECQEYIKRCVNPEVLLERSCDDKYVSLEGELRRKDAMIANLQHQLELSHKASDLNKPLWESCIRQVEILETQKSEMASRKSQVSPREVGSSRGCQHVSSLPSDFLTKWKLLQTYSESLESRLAKSVSERNFYRSKILDVRFEYEAALKRQAVEKSTEVEHVKASYAKEIEYLKSCGDKLRQHNKVTWEKRLEAEKETWEYEEQTRLQSLKIQVENLIMENELLRQKQLQLVSIMRTLNIGNESSRKGGEETVDVVHAEVQCSFTSPRMKFQSVQTELHGALISADQVHRMKTSQHQLELEYKKILVQLDFTETTAHTKAINLEERIQQLESLNAHLHNQITGLNETNAKLLLKRPDCSVSGSQRVPPSISGNLLEEPSWSKPDDFLVEEKFRVDRSMWRHKLSGLEEEVRRLRDERVELLAMVEEQQKIVNKWKAEVKGLVSKSIQVVNKEDRSYDNNITSHSLFS